MSVLPSVWIMEMDLFNERIAAREQTIYSSNRSNTTNMQGKNKVRYQKCKFRTNVTSFAKVGMIPTT